MNHILKPIICYRHPPGHPKPAGRMGRGGYDMTDAKDEPFMADIVLAWKKTNRKKKDVTHQEPSGCFSKADARHPGRCRCSSRCRRRGKAHQKQEEQGYNGNHYISCNRHIAANVSGGCQEGSKGSSGQVRTSGQALGV